MRSIKGLADEISWSTPLNIPVTETQNAYSAFCAEQVIDCYSILTSNACTSYIFINQTNFLTISNAAQKGAFFRSHS